MKILIAAATSFEMTPLVKFLQEQGQKASFVEYKYQGHSIYPITTGIGSVNMALGIMQHPLIKEIDYAINLGVAGSYHDTTLLGQAVEVVQDRFADLGVEDSDGSFSDLYDLQLDNPNTYPYKEGWLEKKVGIETKLPTMRGLTVNKVSGSRDTITKITNKYPSGQVETMEGAGFMLACRIIDVKNCQIRGISNMVEPRNRSNWKLEEAINAANRAFFDLLRSW